MKRILDIIIAATILLVMAIPMMAISICILCHMGTPIFFVQPRAGLFAKTFHMVKFRTMTNQMSVDGNILPDTCRQTRLGSFLRRTSLDELPELLNVLKGEMSLVGPRPLLVQYVSRYTPEQARRHDVLPGVTGWAQVNGRNALSWEEKFKLDIWYIDNQNIWLDLKILFLTVARVLGRKGITAENGEAMPIFNGIESDNES